MHDSNNALDGEIGSILTVTIYLYVKIAFEDRLQ